jgi:hypothetical protein
MHLIRHDDTTTYETKARYRRCISVWPWRIKRLNWTNLIHQTNLTRFIRCTTAAFIQLNSSELISTIVWRMKQALHIVVWNFQAISNAICKCNVLRTHAILMLFEKLTRVHVLSKLHDRSHPINYVKMHCTLTQIYVKYRS